jgi:3D (Asp-Asp-Asp) domain-containing protein
MHENTKRILTLILTLIIVITLIYAGITGIKCNDLQKVISEQDDTIAKLRKRLDDYDLELRMYKELNNDLDNTNPIAGYSSYLKTLGNQIKATNNVQIEQEDVVVVKESPEYLKISSTAYWNKYNRKCADGTEPIYGTLAGKTEWLGKSVRLYRVADDGDVGELIGTFTFHDVGYGQSTGYGSSSILKGKSLGTIELGQCIDIFISSESECITYGRKDVYMEWID